MPDSLHDAAPVDPGVQQVQPFFFAGDAARLYGCYHAPEGVPAPGPAIVICQATGHEYERSHRAARQLAVQLARAGHPSLRFDYGATGDSAGDGADGDPERWQHDAEAAADECVRRSGIARLCLVGMRLGAVIAARAAGGRADVTDLVLYAPPLDGVALVRQWRDDQAAFDRKGSRPPRRYPDELLGYPFGRRLREKIEAGLTLPQPAPALRRVLILAAGRDPALDAAVALLGSRGATVTIEAAEGPAVWREEPSAGIVPFRVLSRIVSWVGGAA